MQSNTFLTQIDKLLGSRRVLDAFHENNYFLLWPRFWHTWYSRVLARILCAMTDRQAKYISLLSELFANLGVFCNGRCGTETQIALAILIFVFGILEGGAICWKSRLRKNGDKREGEALGWNSMVNLNRAQIWESTHTAKSKSGPAYINCYMNYH